MAASAALLRASGKLRESPCHSSLFPADILRRDPLKVISKFGKFFPNFRDRRIHSRAGNTMRISDDRYSRDRLRLDLALRFIHHEARTHTIRAWTGLTDDRIRKLYRTYLYEAGGAGVT